MSNLTTFFSFTTPARRSARITVANQKAGPSVDAWQCVQSCSHSATEVGMRDRITFEYALDGTKSHVLSVRIRVCVSTLRGWSQTEEDSDFVTTLSVHRDMLMRV